MELDFQIWYLERYLEGEENIGGLCFLEGWGKFGMGELFFSHPPSLEKSVLSFEA